MTDDDRRTGGGIRASAGGPAGGGRTGDDVRTGAGGLSDYELSHLVAHLAAAGRTGDVHALLRLGAGPRFNYWYDARVRAGQTAGYLADLEYAWTLAERDTAASGCGDLGAQLRYALVTASMRSRARNTPPGFLAALVGAGIMGITEALSRLDQVPDGYTRAQGLVRLAESTPPQAHTEILAAVQRLPERRSRSGALFGLVSRLPRELLPRVAELLEPFGDGDAEVLSGIVSRYAETDALDDALALLGRFPEGYPWSTDRAECELAVAERFGAEGVRRLLGVPGNVWSWHASPDGLARLAGQRLAPGPDRPPRTGRRGAHRSHNSRHFLGEFLPYLPPERRAELDPVALAGTVLPPRR